MLSNLLKNGVDPKWIVVLAWLVGVQKGVGQGAISLTNMVPESWIPHVIAWNNGLAWFGVGVMGLLAALSSNASGPMIPISLPSIDAKNVPKIALVAFALSFLVGIPSAHAQVKLHAPAVTGDLNKDIKTDLGIPASASAPNASPVLGQSGLLTPDALIKKIIALSAPDLVYSAAMAKSANTNAATVRLGCITAIQTLNTQASGANLKDANGNALTAPGEPHVFTDLETIAEGIDSLSPTGPLFTSCAGAAAMAGMNVLAFINALATGTAAAALIVPK